ncbi:protein kinase [Quadrisphaera sp. INWT6]|uniref:protein kinase n=1 Tax=Quadrisphaera sp. INWT6 TaxID=2596917 RepID=UPI00189220FD|nr:protein kinase [Quadrisphaera sp. INWT6]
MIVRARRRPDPTGPSAPEVPGLVVGAPVAPRAPGRPVAWWAVDEHDRTVVVQRVRPASGTTAPLAALDEATRRRALPHPHLVPLLQVVRCREGAVQVLGPVVGGLADLLAAGPALSAGQVVVLVAGLGSALAALHDEGLVHGELDARAVLVDERGMPVLLGWGAARPAPRGRAEVRRREQRAGGPGGQAVPRAGDDVLALARLGLGALGAVGVPGAGAADGGAAGGGAAGGGAGEQLRHLLVAAAAEDAGSRPSAGQLASACWELAAAEPLDADALRSLVPRAPAGHLPAVPLERAVRRGRWRAGWARRPERWALVPLGAAALVLGAAAATGVLPPGGEPLAVVPLVATRAPGPAVVAPGAATAPVDERLTGDDPAAAVAALSDLRVAALAAGDAALLGAVDVPASPAERRDGALLASLDGRVQGLRVDVVSARTRQTTDAGTWVEVVSAASAHRVVSADGVREVAASAPVTSRLLLQRDAGAWKVADAA